jgi:transposase
MRYNQLRQKPKNLTYMPRLMLTDETWNVLSRIMHLSGRIYKKPEHRKTLEGILYKMRTGIPWRDLPPCFGTWSAIYRRFNLWSKKDVLNELFRVLSRDADTDWLFIDGSIVRAHQHSTGAATAENESIGKSRVGIPPKSILQSIAVAYLFTMNYRVEIHMILFTVSH